MNKRKKIIYIGNFIFPNGNAATLRAFGNAKALICLGYDVVLVSKTEECFITKDSNNLFTYEMKENEQPIKNIEYVISFKKFENVIKKFDNVYAVILYNFPTISFLYAINLCKRYGYKCFGDITEYYYSKTGNLLFDFLKNVDSIVRMKYLIFKLDGIISINHLLSNKYRERINVITIPPLVDLDEMKWKSNYVEPSLLTFTFFGSKSRKKEKEYFSVLLDAFAKLNHYQFKIIIIGIDRKSIKNESEVAHHAIHELGDKIIFTGKLDHISTLEHVINSHFSIFYRHVNRATLYGFPTKFVESISCGTPVITNSTGVLKQYYSNDDFGYLLNDDVTSDIEKAMNLNRNKILLMKEKCRGSMTFHYINYLSDFRPLF